MTHQPAPRTLELPHSEKEKRRHRTSHTYPAVCPATDFCESLQATGNTAPASSKTVLASNTRGVYCWNWWHPIGWMYCNDQDEMRRAAVSEQSVASLQAAGRWTLHKADGTPLSRPPTSTSRFSLVKPTRSHV